MDHQGDRGTILKITVYQMTPSPAGALRRFRIAVPRQVNEVESVQPIEVDAPGLARRRTGSGQVATTHQPINQAGFPDVRPARQDDFRNPLPGELPRCERAHDKFGPRDQWHFSPAPQRGSMGRNAPWTEPARPHLEQGLVRDAFARTVAFEVGDRFGDLPLWNRQALQSNLQNLIHGLDEVDAHRLKDVLGDVL